MTRPKFAAFTFLMLVLLAIGAFLYVRDVRAEKAHRDDLATMRSVVDQYTLDQRHEPRSLDDLVRSGYLRRAASNEKHLEELFREASDSNVGE